MLLLGCHVSISGGLYRCFSRGEELGCTVVQIFTKSQLRWDSASVTREQAERFASSKAQTKSILLACAHGSYLCNFASPDPKARDRSISCLMDELSRCENLDIPLLIIHPGAHMGAGEILGVRRIVRSLRQALTHNGGRTVLCIETTAGQGTGIGSRFEHLRDILDGVGTERIAVCIDTCHIFAAGYDIGTQKAYRSTMKQFDRIVGLAHVKVMHLNDSKGACGSKTDRHAHIGEGSIGMAAFTQVMRDDRFEDVPKIIETPKKSNGLEMDAVNLTRLRECIEHGRSVKV